MSGGSFDYLCAKDGVEALLSPELDRMAEELAREFPDSAAARDTRALLAMREEVTRKVAALQGVWQAVEWWRSLDWGRDSAEQAVNEYGAARQSRPPQADAIAGDYTDFLVMPG